MFTLDTNAIIYYAAGDKNTISFLSERKHEIFYLPSIVVAEFLAYPLIDSRAAALFRSFSQQTIVINLDYSIAELSAEIKRSYHLKMADAVVAATALSTTSTLVTRNVGDFKKISALSLRKI